MHDSHVEVDGRGLRARAMVKLRGKSHVEGNDKGSRVMFNFKLREGDGGAKLAMV